jgi:NAD(P)-dependent dehydrogenase (short-subunit alcohol dehydrogenase family)
MRNLAKADLLRSRAADEGLDVEVVALDVTDDDSVASAVSAVSAIHDRFGLASEVNPFGVRVECIEPGYFATAIQANSDSADDGISGTDYEADGAWFDAFDRSSVDGGADPSVVADAIVAAVDDLDAPLHRVVGDDAELVIALYDQVKTYEGWTEMAMPIVEQTAGPRPAPPPAP